MREVRVTSLQRLEATDGEVRILANSGDLALVFPREVWESALTETVSPQEPTPEELEELLALKQRLKDYARENSFATVLEEVPCGSEGSDQQFDLVQRRRGCSRQRSVTSSCRWYERSTWPVSGRLWRRTVSSKGRTSSGRWRRKRLSPPEERA
jgi:hypothetical protein